MAEESHSSTVNGIQNLKHVEPIAIVGMGCRWPGSVRNPSQLWALLKEGRSGWAEFAPEHINIDGFYHPDRQRPGSMVTKGGYVLQDDARNFDHNFFGINGSEVLAIDPAQRKLLEVTFEAFESAGETLEDLSGSRTGVFVGNFNNDHQLMQFRDQEHTLPYVVTGGGPTMLSNRISYVFDLMGPSLVVDTGCSASMYALHLAVSSLRNGDCDAAIVAGANLILSPDAQIFTSKLGAVSPTSKCHTFDISADGYGRAEGFGAIYLKRLSEAQAKKDPIRALVRGTAFNTNGKTGGISHPSPEGQEAVIRQAYEAAGNLDPDSTGYFECHGTGTPVGDPIEVSAIGKVFGCGRSKEQPLLIGSIKPQLGHSEAASAMSQIMKAVLALENGEIPATIGIEHPNPAIDFERARVKVVTEATPWPKNLKRRVSINSFGYGGANAHCIIDHPMEVIPSYQARSLPRSREDAHEAIHAQAIGNGGQMDVLSSLQENTSMSYVLLPFSAHDKLALRSNIAQISQHIGEYTLSDLIFTLADRRSRFPQRAYAVVQPQLLSHGIGADVLVSDRLSGRAPQNVGFVFTGQGAQWPQMGMHLMETYPIISDTIAYLDKVLSGLSGKSPWTIAEALKAPPDASRIHEPAVSQIVCTALQIALVRLLKQWGVKPVAVVGHSSGEIAAAYAAGRLHAREAIVLAATRGHVLTRNKRKGLMLAVGLGYEAVQPLLVGRETRVQIAAVNSPKNVTLSGDCSAIAEVAAACEVQNVFHRTLRTGENAYHSYHMLALGEEYEVLASRKLGEMNNWQDPDDLLCSPTTWVSSVTPGEVVSSVAPEYWRHNLESPVLFSEAIEVLFQKTQLDLLIEIGPHPALGGLFEQFRPGLEADGQKLPPIMATLRRGEHDVASMMRLAGDLFLRGSAVDLAMVNRITDASPCVDLPTYCFTYPEKPTYYENRFSREFRRRKHPRHDLLGAKRPASSSTDPSWRNVLRLKDVPWLRDHKLLPDIILPATAYLMMAVEAVRQVHFEDDTAQIRSFRLRNVAILSTLRVPDDAIGIETILSLRRGTKANGRTTSSRWSHFTIGSADPDSGSWSEHCSGDICVETQMSSTKPNQRPNVDSRARTLQMKRWYEKFTETGLAYGPAFQGLSNLKAYHRSNSASASVELVPENTSDEQSKYVVHPATLDTCLQLALIACHAGQVENVKTSLIPVAAGEVIIWNGPPTKEKAQAVASGQMSGIRGASAHVALYTHSGEPLISMEQIRLVRYDYRNTDKTPAIPREPYWRPVERVDIDTVSNESLKEMFTPKFLSKSTLTKLDKVCALALRDLNVTLGAHIQKHHGAFAAWLDARSDTLRVLTPTLDTDKWTTQNANLLNELEEVSEAKCIRQLHQTMFRILGSDTPSIPVFIESHLLDELYESGMVFQPICSQLQHIVDLIAHKSPRMSILQIGGAAGGTHIASAMLDTLGAGTPYQRFGQYIYTDTTASGRANAKSKLGRWSSVSFYLLDIETDLSAQEGLEPQSLDLIIAPWQLEFVRCLDTALKNMRALLRPGGRLVLVEFVKPRLSIEFLHRAVTGSWSFGAEKAWSNADWDMALFKCGFSGLDMVCENGNINSGSSAPSSVSSLRHHNVEKALASSQSMLTTAISDSPSSRPEGGQLVYLVYRQYPPPLLMIVRQLLTQRGWNTVAKDLQCCNLPDRAALISFVDIESVTLLHCEASQFEAIQSAVTRSRSVTWLAISRSEAVPEHAVMKGMLRSLRTENTALKLGFLAIEDDFHAWIFRCAELVVRKYLDLQNLSDKILDREWRLADGVAYIERLLPDKRLNNDYELRQRPESDIHNSEVQDGVPLRANFAQPGILSSLYFSPDPTFDKELESDLVEIKTSGIGLNMKDLAVATGRLDWDYLSTEVAGTVCKVGPAVHSSLKVGDRVFGLVPGNMGNFTRSKAALVQKIPNGATLHEAASMPLAYLTALYALRDLGRLSQGESVLIQSAAGSLGMAAIRIAQHVGAKIYATVGTEQKRRTLTDSFGIPRTHIFPSRDPQGVADLMMETGDSGVDVILSSARGDAMDDVWRCIAPGGRFIDVGRTDVLEAGKIGLDVFKRNATFSSFDMGLLHRQKPSLVAKLMADVKGLWEMGAIGPIQPTTTFDISQLEKAMVYFSNGMHTGKVVISFEEPKSKLQISRTPRRTTFERDGAYILVGCLGGLGLSIAVWMAERGARHIVFLSRSGAVKREASAVMEELRAMGAVPEVVRCDVTDRPSVSDAVTRVTSERRLKGVIHAAMVEGVCSPTPAYLSVL
jgi:acyl transferase domain-containing protein/NADPH:quinone reductase-like Zn-dependent oxidoreductase/SAM-dependent methyltransferase